MPRGRPATQLEFAQVGRLPQDRYRRIHDTSFGAPMCQLRPGRSITCLVLAWLRCDGPPSASTSLSSRSVIVTQEGTERPPSNSICHDATVFATRFEPLGAEVVQASCVGSSARTIETRKSKAVAAETTHDNCLRRQRCGSPTYKHWPARFGDEE